MRFRTALAAAVVICTTATPLAAQTAQDFPDLAPAIGPWIGAARGSISDVTPGDGQISLSAVVRDPDSAQGVDYEILVDGRVRGSGTAPRPAGFGDEATLNATVNATPGLHEVCLRLDDPQLGTRTVDCRDAVTAPEPTVDPAVAAAATGVAISQTGVVLPILGGTPNNLQVRTPCGATATVTNAEIVERAQIVIDPGHGGSETGAVGAGLLEKNVNLVVSEVVIDKFESLGITAELTRTFDYRVPIQTRADIATALAPDVFLSLHHNGGAVRRSSEPGTEIFYGQARPESQRLARILYEEMFAAASQFDAQWVSTVNQGASTRLRGDGLDLFGIHRFSPDIDSVITEFLYLSNTSEAQLMNRADVIEAQAQSIVDGILRWWFEDDNPETPGRRFTDPSSSGTGGFDACVDPPLNGPSQLSAEEVTNAVDDAPALLPALLLGRDPAVG